MPSLEQGAAVQHGSGEPGVGVGRSPAKQQRLTGWKQGGEKLRGSRPAGSLTCGSWSSWAGVVDGQRKRAAGGKGTLQAGKKEGMESGQRSPGVWRAVVEGVKLRGALPGDREKAPSEGPRAGSGRGVQVKVVEGEVVQGR